jgi:hypothetical protein
VGGGLAEGSAHPVTDSVNHRLVRRPSLLDAIVPLVALVVLIGGSLALFGLDALDGPIQVALVLCAMVAALVVLKNGHHWEDIQAAGQQAVASITSTVFILLAVGALIGTWNMSGTIPTLVYYGIQVLSPTWYYAATALICGVIAMSIGSSWTTAGTIGVGLVGIALMLGVSPGITAGAVISGAYLGDKLSPLSETTVLTAQLVKVNVYEHIKRQAWISVPAFGIAFVLFGLIGLFWGPAPTDAGDTATELTSLGEIYWITPLNLLPLLLLVVLSVRRVPTSLALMGLGDLRRVPRRVHPVRRRPRLRRQPEPRHGAGRDPGLMAGDGHRLPRRWCRGTRAARSWGPFSACRRSVPALLFLQHRQPIAEHDLRVHRFPNREGAPPDTEPANA